MASVPVTVSSVGVATFRVAVLVRLLAVGQVAVVGRGLNQLHRRLAIGELPVVVLELGFAQVAVQVLAADAVVRAV